MRIFTALLASMVFAIFAVYRVEETRYGRDGVSVSFRRISLLIMVTMRIRLFGMLGLYSVFACDVVSAGTWAFLSEPGWVANCNASASYGGVRPNSRKSCTAYIERNATLAAFAVWPAGVGPALQLLYFFCIRRAAEDQSTRSGGSFTGSRFGVDFHDGGQRWCSGF